MEEMILPKVGAVYKLRGEVRQVIAIHERAQGYPDVIFKVPEKNSNLGQWLPIWEEWVRNAEVIVD